MIGFLIGTACLIGLGKVLHHGHGCNGYGGRWGHGYGPRAGLRWLFERLDTSPGQEKVILGAVEDLWRMKRELVEELSQTHRDVARAMRGERFDEAALDEAFRRQDTLHAKLRAGLKTALAAVHEALDDRQRKLAGDMLEGQIGAFGCGHGRCHGRGGPYRTAWV